MKIHLNHIAKLFVTLLLITATACSTTCRLGEGEVLYTGVKKLNYRQDSVKLNSDVKDQIFDVINVKPNNPLYSPYYRTPFPIGLWVYNHWDSEAKGFKGWLYKILVARPVLISRVRPQTRVDMINTLLRNNGYFSSSANYELNYNKKNPKKASITYNVNVNPPYVLGDIKYVEDKSPITHIIDSCGRANAYFKTGSRYCLDSLNQVRIDITNDLRNRGYYYYMPEYLEYIADSVTTPGVIHMQMVENGNIPNSARTRYLMNDVTVVVDDSELGGTPDTTHLSKADIIRLEPVHVRNSVIHDNLFIRKNRPFRVGNMDRTQYLLSRTGIFSSIDMQVEPVDTITPDGDGLMNLNIFTVLDKPIEAKVEVQGVSKSSSFIGPGLNLSLAHKNLFGGGERLSGDLTMSYEWQTGKGGTYNDKDLNSYEFGMNVELAIPKLLAPRFVDRSRRFQNWTRISLHGNLMNRPGFFKMIQAGGDFTWEWHTNRYSMHSFTPFKLTYSELLNTTTAFDSTMFFNPALAQSFKDMFIPEMRYTYTYDNQWGNDAFNWTSTVIEAGNVFAGIWALAGKHGEKLMFNTTFSQFVKAQTQLVWKHYFNNNDFCLASRLFIGAAYAYGNLDEVPYREQFYIGGANSLRAFTVRTVGPGSYNPFQYDISGISRNLIAYYDQVGDFKFETNWELRFPIISIFKGAVFFDAGNIWLLKEDEYRPGGKLKFKNFFKELATGTGLGVRLDISMLVIRADLGIGLHLPYDTGKKGYFNIPKFKDSLAFHLAIGYPF